MKKWMAMVLVLLTSACSTSSMMNALDAIMPENTTPWQWKGYKEKFPALVNTQSYSQEEIFDQQYEYSKMKRADFRACGMKPYGKGDYEARECLRRKGYYRGYQ